MAARGCLVKQGGRIKSWRRRWFVFDRVTRTLSYYAATGGGESEGRVKGSIAFTDIKDVFVDHERRAVKSPQPGRTFCVVTAARTYYMVAPSCEVRSIWVDIVFTGAEGHAGFSD